MLKAGLSRRSVWIGWAAVILLAFGVRAGLWFCYHPVTYSDTNSYRRLANAIHNPNWKGYDGTRTPGYPLLMAFLGSDQRIYLAQLGMGLAITWLLCYIGWQISGQAWFGGGIALAHSLNLGQLFFEADLLTETPTTFWIMLALAGLAFWLYHPKQRSIILAVGMGLAASAAALTRPLFIYLPVWILIFMLLEGRRLRINFDTITTTVAFLLPVALLFGAWVNFIHNRFHDWALTTMTGYHMVQHTGGYFEYVPDKYAALRDTYIKYRDAQIAQHGTQANAIWDAIPEMTQVSGMTFFDLNRTLARISIQLVLKHPGFYLRDCVQGWWMFWRSPVYWSQDAFRTPGLAAILRPMIWIERLALMATNLLFVLLSVLVTGLALRPRAQARPGGWIERLRSSAVHTPAFIWCVTGSIWGASILQTLLDHGDNPRFLVPLQSLVVLWMVWFGWQIRHTTGGLYPPRPAGPTLVE
jgi:hypothetical protein